MRAGGLGDGVGVDDAQGWVGAGDELYPGEFVDEPLEANDVQL